MTSGRPPSDKSRDNAVVVQAFHVGYWDYIGWVDRFAAPACRPATESRCARKTYTITPSGCVLNGEDQPRWSAGSPVCGH
jgi:hypothetical protein